MRAPRRLATIRSMGFRMSKEAGMRPRGRGRIAGVLLATGVLAVSLPAAAEAAHQFRLDSSPQSFGAVAVDSAGNGYVSWEHGSLGATWTPMFCKLRAGATRCAHPIALSLPPGNAGGDPSANEIFPILGPGATVWLVTSRYVDDDTLIWTSTDGGTSFGAAHVIPYITCAVATSLCEPSYSYADGTDIDDAVPVTPSYAAYGGQTYLTSGGQPSVYWLESSFDPFLGFNLDNTAETLGGPMGASEFLFHNPGGGGVAGSTLAATSTGDVVEAYWRESTPMALDYYVFPSHNPNPISPQAGWTGPISLGDGYLPRLADGAKGLFLLSADGSGQTPNSVDIRTYDTATHTFGSPHRIAGAGNALFDGGGLGENFTTGELAIAWPTFGGSEDLMRLFVSSDGGARYTSAEDIATVAGGYRDADNARVAVDRAGRGFVTFVDGRGLEVADLYPLSPGVKTLHVSHQPITLPVSCTAPKGKCKVTLSLARPGSPKLERASFEVSAGTTRSLKLGLGAAARSLLTAHHNRLRASLTLKLQLPGVSAYETSSGVSLVG
jgi:hypothetical protein